MPRPSGKPRRKLLSEKSRDTVKFNRKLTQAYERIFPDSADRLWLMRNTLGMTQRQMAEECRLSSGVISNVECGYGLPKGTSLQKIGSALGISADYLLNLSSKQKTDR